MMHFRRCTTAMFPPSSAPPPKLITIIDGHNLMIGAQMKEDPTTGETRRDLAIRLHVAQTVDFLANNRQFDKQILVAGHVESQSSIWKLWRDQNFETQLLPCHAGLEVAVDDVMHAQAFHELSKDFREPRILQLVTGDGNGNHGRTNFRDVVVAALRKNPPVRVEIYAFRRSCSQQLRSLERQYPSQVTIVELDPYREALTYRQTRKPVSATTTSTSRTPSNTATARISNNNTSSTALVVANQLRSWIVNRHGGGPMLTSAPLDAFYQAHPGAREMIQEAKRPGRPQGIQSFIVAHSAMLRSTRSANGQPAIKVCGSVSVEQQASSDEESTSSNDWDQVNLAVARSLQDAFVCPIAGDMMTDPVFTSDGHTYERAAIEQWFASTRAQGGQPTSPLTGLVLANTNLIPNIALRGQIRSITSE